MPGVQGSGVVERRELSSRGLDPYDCVLLGVGAVLALFSSEDRVQTGLAVLAGAALLAVTSRFRAGPTVYLEGSILFVDRGREEVQIPLSAIRDVKVSGWRRIQITLVLDERANFGTRFTFNPNTSWDLKQRVAAARRTEPGCGLAGSMSRIDIPLRSRWLEEQEPSMDQMNVSITDELAGFVRGKVNSGRYNNASQVVCDALRRMEEEENRALRLAKPSAADLVADLTMDQQESIRQRVRASIASDEFSEYEGQKGLRDLAAGVKAPWPRALGRRFEAMKRYPVSKDAERDLDRIFLYWALRASVDVADPLIDAIIDRFWLLGEHPSSGVACESIAPGVRCFAAGKHLIYYKKIRGGVEILQVFDGSKDQQQAWS